jgi:hypothetical protein
VGGYYIIRKKKITCATSYLVSLGFSFNLL